MIDIPSTEIPSTPMATATTRYVPASTTDSVADLLLRVADRDPAAWNEILRRYGKHVSKTVRSFRLQEADALDAVQMTWLRLAENARRVQFPERLGGWLATTARRECLHIIRRAKFSPNLVDLAPDTIADPSTGPEHHVIRVDTMRTLCRLVDELSPRQRTLIRMLFTDNPRSYAEVTRDTGIPQGGIGPTRARALRQLQDKLDEHKLDRTLVMTTAVDQIAPLAEGQAHSNLHCWAGPAVRTIPASKSQQAPHRLSVPTRRPA